LLGGLISTDSEIVIEISKICFANLV